MYGHLTDAQRAEIRAIVREEIGAMRTEEAAWDRGLRERLEVCGIPCGADTSPTAAYVNYILGADRGRR